MAKNNWKKGRKLNSQLKPGNSRRKPKIRGGRNRLRHVGPSHGQINPGPGGSGDFYTGQFQSLSLGCSDTLWVCDSNYDPYNEGSDSDWCAYHWMTLRGYKSYCDVNSNSCCVDTITSSPYGNGMTGTCCVNHSDCPDECIDGCCYNFN